MGFSRRISWGFTWRLRGTVVGTCDKVVIDVGCVRAKVAIIGEELVVAISQDISMNKHMKMKEVRRIISFNILFSC